MKGYSTVNHTVRAEHAGRTVSDISREALGLSRRVLRSVKSRGRVLLDGRPARLNDRVSEGHRLTLMLPESAQQNVIPESLAVEVRYEDEQVLVVDKPSGVVTHPVPEYSSGTLVNAVAGYFLSRGLNSPVRPLSRLDRETSGLIVFPKSMFAYSYLRAQMHTHLMDKRYVAFVHGTPPAQRGTISIPVDRDPERPWAMTVLESGRPATTHYRLVGRLEGGSLLYVTTLTGRMHQIRVHLAYLGNPVLGDPLYGHGEALIDRLALHARSLTFRAPFCGERRVVSSPLPPDMSSLL